MRHIETENTIYIVFRNIQILYFHILEIKVFDEVLKSNMFPRLQFSFVLVFVKVNIVE